MTEHPRLWDDVLSPDAPTPGTTTPVDRHDEGHDDRADHGANRHTDPGESPRSLDGYADLSLADGTVLVYDAGDHTGWVQSDAAIPREDVR